MSELRQSYRSQIRYHAYNFDREQGRRSAQALGVMHYPAIVLIDRHGQVARRIFGIVPTDDLRPALEALIAAP